MVEARPRWLCDVLAPGAPEPRRRGPRLCLTADLGAPDATPSRLGWVSVDGRVLLTARDPARIVVALVHALGALDWYGTATVTDETVVIVGCESGHEHAVLGPRHWREERGVVRAIERAGWRIADGPLAALDLAAAQVRVDPLPRHLGDDRRHALEQQTAMTLVPEPTPLAVAGWIVEHDLTTPAGLAQVLRAIRLGPVDSLAAARAFAERTASTGSGAATRPADVLAAIAAAVH